MQPEFVQTNKGSERVFQRSKLRKTPVVRLKDYDVFVQLGFVRVRLGRVFQSMATMERKTPGRMYVDARWESPRWYYEADGDHFRNVYSSPLETRREATQGLIDAYKRLHVL